MGQAFAVAVDLPMSGAPALEEAEEELLAQEEAAIAAAEAAEADDADTEDDQDEEDEEDEE